ncbi:MAG: hypothetical protein Q6373_010975, partial [Candidatus Sigynarchaeota archaeon]
MGKRNKLVMVKLAPHPKDSVTKKPGTIKMYAWEIRDNDAWKVLPGERIFFCFAWFPKETYPDNKFKDFILQGWNTFIYTSPDDLTPFILIVTDDLSRALRLYIDGVYDGFVAASLSEEALRNAPKVTCQTQEYKDSTHYTIGRKLRGKVIKVIRFNLATFNHLLKLVSS